MANQKYSISILKSAKKLPKLPTINTHIRAIEPGESIQDYDKFFQNRQKEIQNEITEYQNKIQDYKTQQEAIEAEEKALQKAFQKDLAATQSWPHMPQEITDALFETILKIQKNIPQDTAEMTKQFVPFMQTVAKTCNQENTARTLNKNPKCK